MLFFLPLVTCLRIVSAASRSYTIPQGHGPYRVHLETRELDDRSRQDPYNASHIRRLMISRFDPQPAVDCKQTKKVPYFPPAVAQAEADILAPYDYPKDIWAKFNLEVCESPAYPTQKYPVALFSPGLNTSRLFYNSLATEITSHGFTVITIDHPYDVDVVQFPNGDIIYGGSVKETNASLIKALDVRGDDCKFVLNALGLNQNVVMFGQSFGGAAAATAERKDPRIRGGVNLDGFMFGPVVSKGIPQPQGRSFLLWGSDGHNTTDGQDTTWATFWASIEREKKLWKREMSVKNSTHGSYWDVNILVDVAGIRDSLTDLAQLLIGPIPGERVWHILGRYLPAYFRFALGAQEDEIYEHPSKQFPEVEILR